MADTVFARGGALGSGRSASLVLVGLLAVLTGCGGERVSPTVHVAEAATLELPPVPGAPARLEVVAYGMEPDAGPEVGRCAVRLRDPNKYVIWTIDAAQSWESTEVRGDTTFVHHVAIGDYVPRVLGAYAMSPGQVARVDCSNYDILGLTRTGS